MSMNTKPNRAARRAEMHSESETDEALGIDYSKYKEVKCISTSLLMRPGPFDQEHGATYYYLIEDLGIEAQIYRVSPSDMIDAGIEAIPNELLAVINEHITKGVRGSLLREPSEAEQREALLARDQFIRRENEILQAVAIALFIGPTLCADKKDEDKANGVYWVKHIPHEALGQLWDFISTPIAQLRTYFRKSA